MFLPRAIFQQLTNSQALLRACIIQTATLPASCPPQYEQCTISVVLKFDHLADCRKIVIFFGKIIQTPLIDLCHLFPTKTWSRKRLCVRELQVEHVSSISARTANSLVRFGNTNQSCQASTTRAQIAHCTRSERFRTKWGRTCDYKWALDTA